MQCNLLLLGLVAAVGGTAGFPGTWSPPRCALSPSPSESSSGTKTTNNADPPQQPALSAWFADAGTKIFLHDEAPAESCGSTIRVSGARGERVTFQVGVRVDGSEPVRHVKMGLTSESLGELVVRRAGFTNVTTPGNNVTSAGPGLYPPKSRFCDILCTFVGTFVWRNGWGCVPVPITSPSWCACIVVPHGSGRPGTKRLVGRI